MKELTLLFFLGFSYTVQAQTSKILLAKSSPAAAGFSEERIKRIDQNLQKWVEEEQMNGCVGLIYRNI